MSFPRSDPTGPDAIAASGLLRLPLINGEIAVLVDRYAPRLGKLEEDVADVGRSL
jgi:hypothetical protein